MLTFRNVPSLHENKWCFTSDAFWDKLCSVDFPAYTAYRTKEKSICHRAHLQHRVHLFNYGVH